MSNQKYTNEQLEQIAHTCITENQKLLNAISVALEFLPEHARLKVAAALDGKQI